MKIVALKTTVMTASFLAAVGHAGITLAHSSTGSLGSSAGATDVYAVVCSTEAGTATYRLATRVRDNAPVKSPLVSVSSSKGGVVTNTTDTNGDGNSSYSAYAYNNKGNGTYTMSIKKSKSGSENYTASFHCQGPASSGFIHTSTDYGLIQNQ
ncbi:MAG: hypothetical protein ACREV1_18185 [Gammaproteobacteria bacterium]